MSSDTSESKVFPELETARLTLREITLNDLGWYIEHFNKNEIVVGSGQAGPKDLQTAQEEMDLYITGLFRKGLGFRWGLTLKGRKDLIGSCGFYSWRKQEPSQADMGYDLDPAQWNQGLMKEALSEIIRFGFEKMALDHVRCTIMPRNARSIALIEKLGFKRTGIVREQKDETGKLTDDIVFTLKKAEWSSSNES